MAYTPEQAAAIMEFVAANGFGCPSSHPEGYCPSIIGLFDDGVSLAISKMSKTNDGINPGRLPNVTALGWLAMGLPLYVIVGRSSYGVPTTYFFTCNRAAEAFRIGALGVPKGSGSPSVTFVTRVIPENILGFTHFKSLNILVAQQPQLSPAAGELAANLTL